MWSKVKLLVPKVVRTFFLWSVYLCYYTEERDVTDITKYKQTTWLTWWRQWTGIKALLLNQTFSSTLMTIVMLYYGWRTDSLIIMNINWRTMGLNWTEKTDIQGIGCEKLAFKTQTTSGHIIWYLYNLESRGAGILKVFWRKHKLT